MKDVQETTTLGLGGPLGAGVREEVKEESQFPVVQGAVGWGGGRLFGPVCVGLEVSERSDAAMPFSSLDIRV